MPFKSKSNTGDTNLISLMETANQEPELLTSSDKSAEHRRKRRGYYRKWEQKNLSRVRAKQRERFNQRYANDPAFVEKYRTDKREWGRRNADKKRAWTRAWQARNKEHRENYRLQYEYGITLQQYDEILAAQGGVCVLCMKPPTERRLAVDHDHVTGRVRGLMHRTCNSSFRGIFGDDPFALHRAFMRLGYMADVIRCPGTTIPGGMAGIQ
jgi:hypothetical protein